MSVLSAVERLDIVRGSQRTSSFCDDRLFPIVERIVAARVASAAAEAWDKGYTAGHSNAMRRMSDEPHAPTSPNPYRAVLAPAHDEGSESAK